MLNTVSANEDDTFYVTGLMTDKVNWNSWNESYSLKNGQGSIDFDDEGIYGTIISASVSGSGKDVDYPFDWLTDFPFKKSCFQDRFDTRICPYRTCCFFAVGFSEIRTLCLVPCGTIAAPCRNSGTESFRLISRRQSFKIK